MTIKVHPLRALLLVAASAASGSWLANEALRQAGPPATLESLVTAGVLLGGAAAATGVAGATLIAFAQSLLGRRPRAAGALPAPLQRFLLGATVVAIAAGAAVPANAEEAYPGWAPAVISPTPVGTQAAASEGPSPAVHVVARGESLWRIAAEQLGPDASDAAISAAWRAIYQANRDLIGDDPGLILPGQRLSIPQELAS